MEFRRVLFRSHHQAGQYTAALVAGGGRQYGSEVRSELAPAVCSFIDEQAPRRGQGGHRAQAGGSVVLDVALRAELQAGDGARFARGAVRKAQWLRFQADKLIGRPASLAGRESLNKQSWSFTGPDTWLMEPQGCHRE